MIHWTWGEQVDGKSSSVVNTERFSFNGDGRPSVAPVAFLCYLFKYALARTHMHLLTDQHTLILTDWKKRQTLNTHTHTHSLIDTHTHTRIQRTLLCTSFSLTSSSCQWCTCVFVSKCSAKRVMSKKTVCCHLLSFFFYKIKKETLISIGKSPGASQAVREIKLKINRVQYMQTVSRL